MGLAMRSLLEGYGRKKRRARAKLAARTVLRMMIQEDVTCLGMRFPGQWKHLGGVRVSPYACDFGAMWLQIRASVRVTDRRGQSFTTTTDKAMNDATNVGETNLTWKWTSECSLSRSQAGARKATARG